jgi:hypothetical protein
VDFRRIVFTNSTIRRSHRGVAIDCRDESVIEDILVSDIVIETIHSPRIWWQEGEPIWISQVPYVPGHYGMASHVARLRNLVFRNLLITSEQGVYIQGADGEHVPSDLLFENIHIHLHKHTTHPAGFFDPRPNRPDFSMAADSEIEEETPWGNLYRHGLPAFYLDRTRNVTIRNCRVTWSANMPKAYTHALEAHRSPGLQLENFSGEAANAALPKLIIDGQIENPGS